MGKYKALIFDIDGTVMPIGRDSVPSEKVSAAFRNYTGRYIISPATGRQRVHVQGIIKDFNLQSPLILSGGSEIVDHTKNYQVLWEKRISQKLAREIYQTTGQYAGQFILEETPINSIEEINAAPNVIYLASTTPENTELATKKLTEIPDINFYPLEGWTKGKFDIHIVHKDANKGHALKAFLEMMHLEKEEVIAVGDSINDYVLFENAGLKIAMGNADDKLKSMADLVVGDVDHDGVIEALAQLDS